MLFIISAMGLIGGLVIGLDGLMLGSTGQLERIVAIACFAVAAGALVGLLADDGLRTRRRARERVEHGDVLHAIAVAPILALSVGVFVATLIPAVYVMLPFFALWWLFGGEHRHEPARVPARAAERPLHAPAYT